MTTVAERQWDAVRALALAFPNAIEDFPWGVPAIKVDNGSKWPTVFVGLAVAGAFPTTMSGVGQFGRLTVPLPVADLDLLFDWVDESYRLIAPKRLVKVLDARGRPNSGGVRDRNP